MKKETNNIGIVGVGSPGKTITPSITRQMIVISGDLPKDLGGENRDIAIAQGLNSGKASQLLNAIRQGNQPGGPEEYEPNPAE